MLFNYMLPIEFALASVHRFNCKSVAQLRNFVVGRHVNKDFRSSLCAGLCAINTIRFNYSVSRYNKYNVLLLVCVKIDNQTKLIHSTICAGLYRPHHSKRQTHHDQRGPSACVTHSLALRPGS